MLSNIQIFSWALDWLIAILTNLIKLVETSNSDIILYNTDKSILSYAYLKSIEI